MSTNAAHETPRTAEQPGPYILWCEACRRTEECPPDRLDAYAREGWPRCCDRQMYCWAVRDR